MIYLDTNIVAWLYANSIDKLSNKAQDIINDSTQRLKISPMVVLELEYLYEIKRVKTRATIVINALEKWLNLEMCNKSFLAVIQKAQSFSWTRDPFDRIITAQAAMDNNKLITADQKILKHYKYAIE